MFREKSNPRFLSDVKMAMRNLIIRSGFANALGLGNVPYCHSGTLGDSIQEATFLGCSFCLWSTLLDGPILLMELVRVNRSGSLSTLDSRSNTF